MKKRNVLITGCAGYIGSYLTGYLLDKGYRVIGVDKLLFGIESLLPFFPFKQFSFHHRDVTREDEVREVFKKNPIDFVVHLAAIVGFPACQQVGEQVAYLYNTEATRVVHRLAEENEVLRFVFASTYSNYGLSSDGLPVTEESPLQPCSLYAETKIKAEEYLLSRSRPLSTILRFATLYGLSPRTRFDLIINQFVLEAFHRRKLIIYQRGYHRSFVHVRDIARAIQQVLESDESKVSGQIFNVGSDSGNYTKGQILDIIKVRIPDLQIEYKDLSFGGDMRDLKVSFRKIRDTLGFETTVSVEQGVEELIQAFEQGWFKDPFSEKSRNASFIVQ